MTPESRRLAPGGLGTPAVAVTQCADERLVGELVMMGIEEDIAAAAAIAVGNSSVEAAMEHIFSGAETHRDTQRHTETHGAAAAATPLPTTGQLEVPYATPVPAADAGAAHTAQDDEIVLLPQASAPPPIYSHATSGTPGCPRCEEMESTCGICLAAATPSPSPASTATVVAPGGDGAAVSERISQVCAMGFSREAAASALEVSGQSVEGAIDLLLSQPPT